MIKITIHKTRNKPKKKKKNLESIKAIQTLEKTRQVTWQRKENQLELITLKVFVKERYILKQKPKRKSKVHNKEN